MLGKMSRESGVRSRESRVGSQESTALTIIILSFFLIIHYPLATTLYPL